VLTRDPILAWAVRWDETGTAMAVWTLSADEPVKSATPTEIAQPSASAAAPNGIVGSPAATAVPVAPDQMPTSVDANGGLRTMSPAGSLPAETEATGTPAATPAGRLSLYRVELATGVADLAHPMLDAVPADGGFSLRTGRLAWTSPASGERVLQVLAWSGTRMGRLELPAATGTMIVP
jgi:hypothetical protein